MTKNLESSILVYIYIYIYIYIIILVYMGVCGYMIGYA